MKKRRERREGWSSGIGRHGRFRLCSLWVQVPPSVGARVGSEAEKSG